MKLYGLDDELTSSATFSSPELGTAVEMLAIMDIPTFIWGRQVASGSLGLWARHRARQESVRPEGRLTGVETLSGLPRSLLDIFSYISEESAELAFLVWPGEVGDVPHCHMWEAYRLAGILIGRRVRRKALSGGKDRIHPPLPYTSLPEKCRPDTEVLVSRLVAALDALGESSCRVEYRSSLAYNSMMYPYVAARLEVAVLRRNPSWISILRRSFELCKPYKETENVRVLSKMLDEALENDDDDYDVDQEARRRSVELSAF